MRRSIRLAAMCLFFVSAPARAQPGPFRPDVLRRFGLSLAETGTTQPAATAPTTPRRQLPPHASDTEVAESSDGQTAAWFAGDQGDVHVVVNDVPRGERFQEAGQVWLSADGQHIAFAAEPTPAAGAERTFKKRLFVDGKPVGDFFAVAQLAFNPADASHAAWVAALTQPLHAGDGGFDVYVDGTKYGCGFRWLEPGDAKDRPDGLVFSPDGKRWAARGQVFGPDDPQHGGIGGYAVMIDGKMGPTFADVVKGDLTFTPDSHELLYVAGTPRANDFALYRNGVASAKRWPYVAPYSLAISPDGKHVGYGVYAPVPNPDPRFAAEDVRPDGPREAWVPGEPCFAVDDTIVARHTTRIWQNADWSHRLWLGGDGPAKPNGELPAAIFMDGTRVTSVTPETQVTAAAFDGTSAHYAVALAAGGTYAERLIVDGTVYAMSMQPPIAVRDARFVNGKPELFAESAMGPTAWLTFDASKGQAVK